MRKIILSILLLSIGMITMNAQSSKSTFLRIGGANTSFQDVKYSKVTYSGVGVVFDLGFEKEGNTSIWSTGLSLGGGAESAATHDFGAALAINAKVYFRYLKSINDKFSIGGHWDLLGLSFRSIDGLGNNGNYYLSSSDLLIATNYKKGKFNFGLDVGLLSFVKEGTGFGFSAPQNGLENGEFDYQNEDLEDPFGFQYYNLRNTFNHLILRTNVNYKLHNRFTVGYQWNVRQFAEVENYPVTMAAHTLSFRWNFIHRSKEAS